MTPSDWNQLVERVVRNLDPEVRAFNCWLQAALVREGSRLLKIPHPTYDKVDEYLTFNQACEFNPRYNGCLGFSNYGGAPVTILDHDNAFSGAGHQRRLTPTAYNIVRRFPGYWEVSPSGNGIRSFVLGEVPERPDGKSKVNIHELEIFRRSWATVTGNVLYGEANPAAHLNQELIGLWLTPPTTSITRTAAKRTANNPGSWTAEILGDRLEAWHQAIRNFVFEVDPGPKHGFFVPCPGNWGWADGNKHSEVERELNNSCHVWIENGLPVFKCHHEHCNEPKKTWLDFQNYYDPGRRLHSMDAVMDAAIQAIPQPAVNPPEFML